MLDHYLLNFRSDLKKQADAEMYLVKKLEENKEFSSHCYVGNITAVRCCLCIRSDNH